MANQPQIIIYDGLGSFPKGMNSGLDAFDLPKDQLSFAVNATVRGNFVTNRPAYQIQTITYPSDEIGAAFEKGLFQGANYLAPDSGQQQLIAQISGRLYTFTPDPVNPTGSVMDVTIPGDPNPAGLPQAWLEQVERWCVVNNGQNNVIAYDTGTQTSRRLNPTSSVQGTSVLASTPTTPAINGTMVLTLSAPYTGPINQAIQIVEYDVNDVVAATTNYVVLTAGGSFTTYNVTLKNLGDQPGAVNGSGSSLIIQPSNLGNIVAANVILDGSNTMTMQMSQAIPNIVQVGNYVSIEGDISWKIVSITNGRKTVKVFRASGVLPTPSVWSPVFLVGGSQPSVVIGQLSANFIAPATGGTVPAILVGAFTYPVGTVFFINSHQYQITAYNPVFTPPAANTVTLLNLNDSRAGHVFNSGAFGFFPAQIFNFPELPPGRMGSYSRGRFWESLVDGISFMAGDAVGGSSGSPIYNYRDAVLKSSENTYLANGGVFHVPSNLGQISAMKTTAQLDASLGQGPLMVVTPGGVFSCDAPPDRTTWSTLTNPIVSEALIGLGGLSQPSSIVVNGDLLFRSVDGVRSLIMARRDFWSWGNAPISFEMNRVLLNDNVAGLPFVSSVQSDNRMLMGCAPIQGPQGVYCAGLIATNFDPVSSIQGKGPAVYDGLWTGINVLQIIEGQFSGVHRCFAFTWSETQGKIQIYEILKTGSLDNGATPITWSFELPMLFKDVKGKGLYDLISLEDGEFYIKDIAPGTTLNFKVEYRPDFATCWYPWHEFTYCNDTNSTSAISGDRLGLGKPPSSNINTVNGSSANYGRWMQVRFTITGHCVWMGLKAAASVQPQTQFARVISSRSSTPPICR